MVQSSEKGRRGEREVARLCYEWWSQVDVQCEFNRTPLSGGWSTSNMRSHFRVCGDIMTTSDKWPFTVEVKRREDWSLNNLFNGKPTAVWQWWIQAYNQAREEHGVPMLWIKRNSDNPSKKMPWLIMLPVTFIESKNLPIPDVFWNRKKLMRNGVYFGREMPAIYIDSNFLNINPYRIVGE